MPYRRFHSWAPAAGVAVLAVGGILALQANTSNQTERATKARTEICELAKADRIDSARALTAQADYLNKVLAAASVKEDVKKAARRAIQLESESANQQRRRLYKCGPLVQHGKKELDWDAVREAQGSL